MSSNGRSDQRRPHLDIAIDHTELEVTTGCSLVRVGRPWLARICDGRGNQRALGIGFDRSEAIRAAFRQIIARDKGDHGHGDDAATGSP